MKRLLSRCMSVVVASLLVCACSGSGDGVAGSPSDDGGMGANGTTPVNGPFTGTLFIGEESRGWTLDVASGNFDRIPGVRWDSETDTGREWRYEAGLEATARPVTGEEFVLTVDGCEIDRDARFSNLHHCIALHDASGTELAVRLFESDVGVEAQLSPSGTYIAVVSDNNVVTVLDRNLDVISQARASEPIIWSLAWLPSERLLYTSNYAIFITDPAAAAGRELLRFDEDLEHQIKGLAASPDGEHLAFSHGDDVVVVTISTGEVRKLPITEAFGFLTARMPAWSPDGRHLAIKIHGVGLTWTDITGDPTIPAGTNVFIRDAVLIVPMEFGQTRENGEQILDAHVVRARTSVMNRGASNAVAELEANLELDDEDTFWWVR